MKNILVHEDNLRAMVTSREWVFFANAKIIRITEPIVRVLQIVDSDDRPSMRYLYVAIHYAKEEILKRIKKKRAKVQPFLDIINNRWVG